MSLRVLVAWYLLHIIGTCWALSSVDAHSISQALPKNSAGGASTAPPARSTKIRQLGLNFARLGFGTRLVADFDTWLVAGLGTQLADHLGARLVAGLGTQLADH